MKNDVPGVLNGACDGLVSDTAFVQHMRVRTMSQAVQEYRQGVIRQDVTVVHHKWEPLVTGAFLDNGEEATPEARKARMEKLGIKPAFERNEKGEYVPTGEVYNQGSADLEGSKTQEAMLKAHPPLRVVKPMPLVMLSPEEQPLPLAGETFSI